MYQIHVEKPYLEKDCRGDQIKQLRIHPPEKGNSKLLLFMRSLTRKNFHRTGHELSIDLGLHDL